MKKILCYTFLFVESVLLFLITLLVVLRVTAFNTSFIVDKFDKNNYYENLSNEIKTEMSYYTNQSGFNDDILNDIFSISDVHDDTNKFILNTFSGVKTEIDTDKLKEKFNTRIEKYIKDNNFKEVNQKEIVTFVDKMASIYSDEIKLMNYTDKLTSVIPKIISVVDEVIIVSVLLCIVFIVINFKIFHRRYFSVILYTSAFLNLFVNVYINARIDIKNLLIYSDSISIIIKDVVNDILSISIIISVIYIVLGLVLSLKKHRKHK